jgi:ssDNA-specific exonuclease RecJ
MSDIVYGIKGIGNYFDEHNTARQMIYLKDLYPSRYEFLNYYKVIKKRKKWSGTYRGANYQLKLFSSEGDFEWCYKIKLTRFGVILFEGYVEASKIKTALDKAVKTINHKF